jgi:hypothetical protein
MSAGWAKGLAGNENKTPETLDRCARLRNRAVANFRGMELSAFFLRNRARSFGWRLHREFVIYSVGPNRTEDGGRPHFDSDQGDIAWQYTLSPGFKAEDYRK